MFNLGYGPAAGFPNIEEAPEVAEMKYAYCMAERETCPFFWDVYILRQVFYLRITRMVISDKCGGSYKVNSQTTSGFILLTALTGEQGGASLLHLGMKISKTPCVRCCFLLQI